MIFEKLRQRQNHKKIVKHYGQVFEGLHCDVLYVPVYANEHSQHPLAMILDNNINYFLGQALRSKRFTGHLTEYLWYIPKKFKGIGSICFFGVGPKERLNLTIFQSILNQVKQLDGFRTQQTVSHANQQKKQYVIMPNIDGQRNRLLKIT